MWSEHRTKVALVAHVPKYIHKVGTGSPVRPKCPFRSFYICFVSSSYPTIAAFITMYIGMGTYPGRWLGRSVGRIGGVHGIDTRCAVITTPAVFLFFSGLCDG